MNVNGDTLTAIQEHELMTAPRGWYSLGNLSKPEIVTDIMSGEESMGCLQRVAHVIVDPERIKRTLTITDQAPNAFTIRPDGALIWKTSFIVDRQPLETK